MVVLMLVYVFGLQRIESEIQIDYLMRRLAEVDLVSRDNKGVSKYCENRCTTNGDENADSMDSETIVVIKRLQEQVYPLFSFLFRFI